MKNLFKLIYLLASLAFVPALRGQTGFTVPDCLVNMTFFVQGAVAPTGPAFPQSAFDNRQTACTIWTFAYANSGFNPVSMVVEIAPDSATPGIPGAFATYTAITGSNPATSVASNQTTFTGPAGSYPAWIRVTATTLTGSGRVTGILYGYRQTATTASGGAGCAAPCVVIGPDAPGAARTQSPVEVSGLSNEAAPKVRAIQTDAAGTLLNQPSGPTVATGGTAQIPNVLYSEDEATPATKAVFAQAPYYFDGLTWNRSFGCNSSAVITLTATGPTQIITLTALSKIRICHISMSAASAVGIQLVQGTGVNCATGPANLTGVYQNATSIALDFPQNSALITAVSQALCVTLSANVNVGGVVVYETAP